jgi:hypothetical protein
MCAYCTWAESSFFFCAWLSLMCAYCTCAESSFFFYACFFY